ncbi:MAG: putative toxin-antitoxin system toxin component, PIN family [Actinomycetota bacterium]|nr:putative toxin-antitoxin system toxin component, PIN family [Actinomycetota bacterium]
MPDKPRVVLDTNVFISAVLFGKTPGEIIKLWQEEAFYLIVSPETLAELIGKLKFKFGLPHDLVEEWQDLISKRSIHVMPEYQTKICRDPEDDKFLDVALNAKADFLVTGDEDLLVLKSYSNVKILRPAEFLDILAK